MPLYLIDPVGLNGRGPFETKTDVAADVTENEVTGDSDMLVIMIDDAGKISFVEDAIDFLEETS